MDNKKNNTKQVFEKVVNYIQTIVDNGEYKKFLKFQKSFRGYSFNNLVLIYSQFPDATRVAGKAKWIKLKRELISNAQKIWIVAPIPRKYEKKVKKVENGEEIETTETISYNAYRYVYVYDISQTTGEEIPLANRNINSSNMSDFFEKLKEFSKFPVYEQEIAGGADGYYSPTRNEIVLEKTLSIDDKAVVLLHELSHGLYDDFDYKTDRNLSEVFVESIAYIVADHFGDPKVVIELGSKIQKCANELITNIENFEMQEEKLAA